MDNSSKIVVAGIVGAAVGAVAGILFAPAKGKKTRQKLANSAEELKGNVAEMVNNTAETVKGYVEEKKEASKEIIHNGAERVLEATS